MLLGILSDLGAGGGNSVSAVSASMASVLIQFLGFWCMLYFRPFCITSSSFGVN